MTTFFEHQRSSYKRSYLRNLISLASSDGALDDSERALLYQIGLKRGLKTWQVTELLEEEGPHTVFIPESLSNRMNLLYDFMQVIHADHHVDAHEVAFITETVADFHLPVTLTGQLLALFEHGAPTADEWRDVVSSQDMVLGYA